MFYDMITKIHNKKRQHIVSGGVCIQFVILMGPPQWTPTNQSITLITHHLLSDQDDDVGMNEIPLWL